MSQLWFTPRGRVGRSCLLDPTVCDQLSERIADAVSLRTVSALSRVEPAVIGMALSGREIGVEDAAKLRAFLAVYPPSRTQEVVNKPARRVVTASRPTRLTADQARALAKAVAKLGAHAARIQAQVAPDALQRGLDQGPLSVEQRDKLLAFAHTVLGK